MVDFVTNKYKFLFVPRKNYFFVLRNSQFSFGKKFDSRKQICHMVIGVYSSRIDFKGIVG